MSWTIESDCEVSYNLDASHTLYTKKTKKGIVLKVYDKKRTLLYTKFITDKQLGFLIPQEPELER
jgi:hypothetical protein